MYLPNEIKSAKILITVKTYPLPKDAFGESVCTAGLLNGEKWIRIFPVIWRVLHDNEKYSKYSWVELDIKKELRDFRQESYCPKQGYFEPIKVLEKIGTNNDWMARKEYVLREVFQSMKELIDLSKTDGRKSLATLKPKEIIDFIIEEDKNVTWKKTWQLKQSQTTIFDLDSNGNIQEKKTPKKLPYIFKYKFLTNGDSKPREISILDWEIGALYWKCLYKTGGDKTRATQLVRNKYFDEFVNEKDLYFFMGTHYRNQLINAENPFMIIGLFYPPKSPQLSLFTGQTPNQNIIQ